MSHDLEDLLEIILQLEKRIIQLERNSPAGQTLLQDDSWYWEHG